MQERIEPPVLLSRLLIFVFAGTVAVLAAMFFTLQNMFPLNHPQVFFLTNQPDNIETIQIKDFTKDDQNLEAYKQAFITEYIRARNEIENNKAAMRQRWGNVGGVVATWSERDIYRAFQRTNMFRAVMNDRVDFNFVCPVEFITQPIRLNKTENSYQVKIRYYCTDSNGQTAEKFYTIRIGIKTQDNSKAGWQEKLNNPLGIKVYQYDIMDSMGDPLNTLFK